MPAAKLALPEGAPAGLTHGLAEGLAAVRAELAVPEDFPAEVQEAALVAAVHRRLPDVDRTDLDLLTIDPAGSRDLDQALHITRAGPGYLVSYAIADVAAFVSPDDPLDVETRTRALTLYAPDRRTPLHPPVLSEGAASLLPGQRRPALLWTLRLDDTGQLRDAEVQRALVRSRDQLSYDQAQAEINGGSPRETLALLAEVGPRRQQREIDRGGVSLQIPDQEVDTTTTPWSLRYRSPLPVEGWNAQISLLTGMAAAHLMLYGQVGILRSLPPADASSLRRLRAIAKALHIGWPAELDYPEFVRSLDPARPDHAAMLTACTSLFRGAGYRAFSGGLPDDAEHAALATDYAHVTAPLRRRVDRFAGECCVALCAGRPVPDWVLRELDALPEQMAAAERREKHYQRAVLDLVEVFLLEGRVGETFPGTIVEVDEGKDRGTVMIKEPAVEARVRGASLPFGHETTVRLASADRAARRVEFELA